MAKPEKTVDTVDIKPKTKIIKPVVSDLTHDAAGTSFRETYDKKGDLLVRIEYYIDSDPQAPVGFKRYLDHSHTLDTHTHTHTLTHTHT